MGCGFDINSSITLSNYEFNPITNTWTTKSIPPFQARMGAFSFSIGNYGYVGSGSINGGAYVLNDFWRYDPVTDNWTEMDSFPGVGRIQATTFVINGKAYVISGVRASGSPNDCWEYDPMNDTWNQMSNPPSGFTPGYVSGFSDGTFAYVGIGGWNSNTNNDFWKFDPMANSWTQMPSLPANPVSRTWCVGGTGLQGGKGFIGLGGGTGTNYIDFWSFDFVSNTWQPMGANYNFPYILFYAKSFILNGETYVGTGQIIGGSVNDIFKFSCESSPIPANLNLGLIAYYPFNSGSINDFSGNNNNLSNTNGAISVNDRNGNSNCAFEFDNLPSSNNQFLTASNTSFLNGLTEYSISLWYKPLDTTRQVGEYEGLINRGLGPSCPDRLGQWSLGLYDCRKAVFARENSIWQISSPCDVVSNTNSWHHLVATYNQVGNTIKLYKDGILQDTATGQASCGTSPITSSDIGDLFIGKYFTGVIDDIFIYNREINQSEVNQLFNLGSSCCQSPILSIDTPNENGYDIYLFPNPTRNFIVIDNKFNLAEEFTYAIYDLSGKQIKSDKSEFKKQISLEFLSNGMYYIKVETKSGKIITKKIAIN